MAAQTRIVIVGAGFAGFEAARRLGRKLGGRADIVLINPTNYFLYLPLLPEVMAGILDPRRIAVSLNDSRRGIRLILGRVSGIDPDHRRVSYTDAEDQPGEVGYDRLVLAAGSVAASLGQGERRAYRHHDLGFVVGLGGFQAAANPLQIPLAGLPAKIVTRGYHPISLPGNRIRTATEGTLEALLPRETSELGLVRSAAVPLDSASPELPRP